MKLGGAGEAFFVERTNQNISQNQSKLPTACPTPFELNEPPKTIVQHKSFADIEAANTVASVGIIDSSKVELTEVRWFKNACSLRSLVFRNFADINTNI